MARKPLSIFTYYLRNKRKAVPVVILLVLAVFIINVLVNIIGSINGTFQKSFESYKYVTQVDQGKKGKIDEATIDKIKDLPGVKDVFKGGSNWTNLPMIAGNTGISIFVLNQDDTKKMLGVFSARLAEGRLPKPGSNEVIISRSIANAKNIKVGSRLDKERDLKVSGILEGPVRIVIASYEYMQKDGRLKQAPATLYVVPKNYKTIESMNNNIKNAFGGDEVKLMTHKSIMDEGKDSMGNLDMIVGVIDFLLILVMAISVGLLNYIYLMQRMNEFGTLEAVGYTPGCIIRRVTGEMLVLTIISFILGIAFSSLVFKLLEVNMFAQKGWYLDLISMKGILFSLPIPFVVLITGMLTVLWRLLRLDPVVVIERRD